MIKHVHRVLPADDDHGGRAHCGKTVRMITSASVPQGPNVPLIPEIHQAAPHAQYVARKGEIMEDRTPEEARQ